MFQYISCCSLSQSSSERIWTTISFQYISCCSLSLLHQSQLLHHKCFNTSHVVVYLIACISSAASTTQFQYISCCSLSIGCWIGRSGRWCFNTSHVVVYHPLSVLGSHKAGFQYISCCSLSRTCAMTYCVSAFQYISCCSLSKNLCDDVLRECVSIHLML